MKAIRRLVPFILVLVLLSGCGGKESDSVGEAMAFRTKLLSAKGCAFTGEITADYGDRNYSFTVECEGDQDGNLRFSVTAPETIAGISGQVEAQGGKLTFDDTALDFGLLADGQVSPVTCPYFMVDAWRRAYLSAAGQTEDGLRITFDSSIDASPLSVDLWLREGVPAFCELAYAGRRILSMEIRNFRFLSAPVSDSVGES